MGNAYAARHEQGRRLTSRAAFAHTVNGERDVSPVGQSRPVSLSAVSLRGFPPAGGFHRPARATSTGCSDRDAGIACQRYGGLRHVADGSRYPFADRARCLNRFVLRSAPQSTSLSKLICSEFPSEKPRCLDIARNVPAFFQDHGRVFGLHLQQIVASHRDRMSGSADRLALITRRARWSGSHGQRGDHALGDFVGWSNYAFFWHAYCKYSRG